MKKKTALLAASTALLLGQQLMTAPIAKADDLLQPSSNSSQAGVPNVTSASTVEDEQSGSGLELTPNAADIGVVQFFKITGITGGTLYLNDGTNEIEEGSYIPVSEAEKGLKFSPGLDANSPAGGQFSFKAQASIDNAGTGLSDPAEAVITVSEANDSPVAANDTLPAVLAGSGDVVIPYADLLGNDNAGAANEADQTLTITDVGNPSGGTVQLDDANQAVVFKPTSSGAVSFEYTIIDNGTTDGDSDPLSMTGTASFTIQAPSDAPTVTGAAAEEDKMNASGLVISPTSAGGAATQFYRISGITGGQLFQHDGVTSILDGGYITLADGAAGLRFLPSVDANGTAGFGFLVQAAPDLTGTFLSNAAEASVAVAEVNDAPVAADDTLSTVAMGTPEVDIPVSDLLANDSAGALNESGQSLSIIDVSGAADAGTLSLIGSVVQFLPNSGFRGQVKFTYTVQDNGTTAGEDDPKTATAEAQFGIADENRPTITLDGDATVFLQKGQSYEEPGYSAEDAEDGDLTDDVLVTGSVNTDSVGTYSLRYNVADQSDNAAVETVRTVRVVSDKLAGLRLNDGAVSLDTFDPSQTEYELSVANGVSELHVAPDLADPTATVVVNGSPLTDGQADLRLNTGDNEITIIVTSQDGSTKPYQLSVTRQAAAPAAADTGTEVRHADVDTGAVAGTVVQVDISRSKSADGHVLDSVVLDPSNADEVVKQAAADGGSVARIVVGDMPGAPADQIDVRVAGAALSKMIAANLGLVIQAGGAQIALAADTLSQMGEDGEELYFRVVPVRTAEEKGQVEQRVLDSQVIKGYAGSGGVKVVGQPMTIETNYANHRTEVTLPLDGISLPADAKEREAFLRSLAVYVEHSDGEKVVENGTLVYDADGAPVGLRIEVQKFSTFTLISANAATTDYVHYVAGYKDGKFRPNQGITRAELAAILARQLKLDPASEPVGQAKKYSDVPDSDWASPAILKLTAAGILTGDSQGKFRPNDAVTRAEIAVVLNRLKPAPNAGPTTGFSDTNGHWASAAIASVKQAGFMNGYTDGSFRPGQKLTRAEAVVLLNRLFNRPAWKETETPSFTDVPNTAWYSADVESAANDIRAYADGRVEKR